MSLRTPMELLLHSAQRLLSSANGVPVFLQGYHSGKSGRLRLMDSQTPKDFEPREFVNHLNNINTSCDRT